MKEQTDHNILSHQNLYFSIEKPSLYSVMAINGITTNAHTPTPISAATKLRRTVEDPNAFLMFPGVYDGYSARIALQVGFDGLYMVRPLAELFRFFEIQSTR
jgi:hypothetical protein